MPAKNAAELIAHAKKNPGKLTYGSSGAGAASHLSGALFAQMAGIDMLHVPYRGMGPAVPDLLGGRIQLVFAPALTVTPHIASGTLRMIGTTGATRSALFPDFPTIAESGLPNYDSLGWFGLFAPASTPPAVVARISADVRTVLTSDDLKKRLAEQGAEPAPSTPAEFKAFVNSDINKWLDLAEEGRHQARRIILTEYVFALEIAGDVIERALEPLADLLDFVGLDHQRRREY